MLGAIVGDVIGSRFEMKNVKAMDFSLFSQKSTFTDDTVLTCAVAETLLTGEPYESTIKKWGLKYPHAGYGGRFKKWLSGEIVGAYNSYGNGSAMRVSPVGYAFNSLEEVLKEAEQSAIVTHNHPEGVKGAKAIASAVFLARTGNSKSEIKNYIQTTFEYDLERTIDEIRPNYSFDVSCQGSVPEAIIAFLESTDYENAIRKGISIGGDSDTIAAMSGSIAAAFYGTIPTKILEEVFDRFPKEIVDLILTFEEKFQ